MSALAEVGVLTGVLSVKTNLTGVLSQTGNLSGGVMAFNGNYAPYVGEYIITPDFSEQTLQTRNKRMADDVTVKPIQVESVTNLGGGRTVYIGGIN